MIIAIPSTIAREALARHESSSWEHGRAEAFVYNHESYSIRKPEMSRLPFGSGGFLGRKPGPASSSSDNASTATPPPPPPPAEHLDYASIAKDSVARNYNSLYDALSARPPQPVSDDNHSAPADARSVTDNSSSNEITLHDGIAPEPMPPPPPPPAATKRKRAQPVLVATQKKPRGSVTSSEEDTVSETKAIVPTAARKPLVPDMVLLYRFAYTVAGFANRDIVNFWKRPPAAKNDVIPQADSIDEDDAIFLDRCFYCFKPLCLAATKHALSILRMTAGAARRIRWRRLLRDDKIGTTFAEFVAQRANAAKMLSGSVWMRKDVVRQINIISHNMQVFFASLEAIDVN